MREEGGEGVGNMCRAESSKKDATPWFLTFLIGFWLRSWSINELQITPKFNFQNYSFA